MESATESRLQRFCVVQVKRCGKSAPVPMETSEASVNPIRSKVKLRKARPPSLSGWLLEVDGNINPR